jgi:hypothetical protein
MIPRFQEQRAQTPTTDFGSYTNELVGKVSLTRILDHSVASAFCPRSKVLSRQTTSTSFWSKANKYRNPLPL